MKTYRIALLPGDGIGPEITDAAIEPLLSAVSRVPNLQVDFTRHDAGAGRYARLGEAISNEVLEDCLEADAVWLAAIGLPDVRKPDGTEVQPDMMVGLRRALNLHAAARPVKSYAGVLTPLKDFGAGIDMVIVRENLEGLFASYNRGTVVDDQTATDTIVITRAGTSKVVDFAFQLAAQRNGRPRDGQRRVTCVDKANVFRSYAFFRKVFFDVAARYREIQADAIYVDAMSLYMVQSPDAFDVLVMENQFGDILSDLGAGLVGGLGLAPSSEIGDEHALFQPSHGSAPDIAGRNIANPAAMILSGAMMLDWLAAEHGDANAADAARLLESAVQSVLEQGESLTRDLGGCASTDEFARTVTSAIGDFARS